MNIALEAANEALHWIKVSLLQVDRFVNSFQDYAESDPRDTTALSADGHFLLNACAQAERALKRAGHAISPEQTLTIRTLRDVHEHWDEHKRTFESKNSSKSHAGLRFSVAHPDHRPWEFRIGETGIFISALRLEDLWDELVGLESELTATVAELAARVGAPVPAAARRGAFPRRESRVVAMTVVMQNIELDFGDVRIAQSGVTSGPSGESSLT
jgi:hypothetical protein